MPTFPVESNNHSGLSSNWWLSTLLSSKMKSLSRIIHSHWSFSFTHIKITFDGWSEMVLFCWLHLRRETFYWHPKDTTLCQCKWKQGLIYKKRVSQSLSEYQGFIGTKMDLQFWHVWLHKLDPPSKREETDGVFWNVKFLPHCENIGSKHMRNNILLNYIMLYIKILKLYLKN